MSQRDALPDEVITYQQSLTGGMKTLRNVKYDFKDNKLVITVDCSEKAIKAAEPSKTGRTNIVGSTGGALPLETPFAKSLSFSLNVMAKV